MPGLDIRQNIAQLHRTVIIAFSLAGLIREHVKAAGRRGQRYWSRQLCSSGLGSCSGGCIWEFSTGSECLFGLSQWRSGLPRPASAMKVGLVLAHCGRNTSQQDCPTGSCMSRQGPSLVLLGTPSARHGCSHNSVATLH